MEETVVAIRQFKFAVQGILAFHRDVLHIYLGAICFLITARLTRKSLNDYFLVLPGLVLSIFLEIPDIWFNLLIEGHISWGECLMDITNTSLIPTLIVFAARLGWIRN